MTRFYHSFPRSSRSLSVKNILAIFPVAFVLCSLFIASCEEDPSVIGKGLLPAGDFVNISSLETIKPVSYTMSDDSVSTSSPSTSYLGQTYDPYFGTTTAGFVSQLRLKFDWPGQNYKLDSVKLVLTFSNVKGASGGTHYLNFYEIASPIKTDTAYYSSSSLHLNPAGLRLEGIELPALAPDTVNNITIKLSDAMTQLVGDRILRDTSMLFHNNIKPDFRSYFPGLYFTLTSATTPVLASLSLVNDGAGYLIIDRSYKNFLILFLSDADGAKHAYYLILDAINRNAAFNVYTYNRDAAEEGKKILHVNDFYIDTMYSYQQSLGGIYTRLILSGLESVRNNPEYNKIAVNKARLSIPYFIDGNIYKNSTVPKRLYLRYRTQSGVRPVVPDFSIDQYSTFFDGAVDTINKVYNFNIPTFVQRYLEDTSGEIKPELEVVSGTGANNVILRANNKTKPVKFDFTFTRF